MRNKQRGFSLIELLIVVAIILIIAAIAIPNLLRSKMAANEASAVGSMRTINTSSVAFSTTYGNYPTKLADLGPSTAPSSTAADLIDSALVTGSKSGYTFTFTATTPYQSYSLQGSPTTAGVTGQRYFYTDQSGVIRYNLSTTASSTDSPIS
jgi:prepilin-type N-terminal cleavage/methylation domain-containing protein